MNHRMILPKSRICVEFEDGSKMSGRAREIILGGGGKKIKAITWRRIALPVDALKFLDDGLGYVVDIP